MSAMPIQLNGDQKKTAEIISKIAHWYGVDPNFAGGVLVPILIKMPNNPTKNSIPRAPSASRVSIDT
jgi:hypothetical protein